MNPITVEFKSASLTYPIFAGGGTFRGMLADRIWTRGVNSAPVSFAALRDVTFTARDGDRVALVGTNGAGKTTLLRMISGIYAPESGSAKVYGSVLPLLGHMPGINQDATGNENIKLAAYTLGVDRIDLPAIIRDVAEFTELGTFLDMPLKTYSAGMSAKLLFGVITALKAEVYALDEFSFSAGDHAFKERAQERALLLMNQAKTIFLASHDDDILRRVCNRALLLEGGRVIADGPVEQVLEHYHRPKR